MSEKRRGIHVLVVDDSAVVRVTMQAALSRDSGISVAVASDPIIALGVIQVSRPDVIVLDLEMPRMDGLTFLARLMAEDPIPVVVCSNLVGARSDVAVRALALGAVDVLRKPQAGSREQLEQSALQIIDTVRGAALARLAKRSARAATAAAQVSPQPRARPGALPPAQRTTDRVVAIGASTGGPQAITQVLTALPDDAPALAIALHMPAGFTATFARRLDELCAFEVKEAEEGDPLLRGRALVAPGNRHMLVVRSGPQLVVRLTDSEPVSRHRPSVDVLFHSVATSVGPNATGVLLTGMGADGADGLAAMHAAGAFTIAQDEASCVVFGMPKEAIARGAADRVVSLGQIPGVILRGA
ncbi:MAG: chemotaxis response regulator protein-glutamate methylesterase [Kofleriaceae bacterium]|nr:chemotaxis response regulator protein-glutamate methylesterase [Kofleriaceae bacterium]